jgi:hypothetical protein
MYQKMFSKKNFPANEIGCHDESFLYPAKNGSEKTNELYETNSRRKGKKPSMDQTLRRRFLFKLHKKAGVSSTALLNGRVRKAIPARMPARKYFERFSDWNAKNNSETHQIDAQSAVICAICPLPIIKTNGEIQNNAVAHNAASVLKAICVSRQTPIAARNVMIGLMIQGFPNNHPIERKNGHPGGYIDTHFDRVINI